MIQNVPGKIKEFLRLLRADLFIIVVITLVSLASFGLGRLSVLYGDDRRGHLEIVYPESQQASVFQAAGAGAIGSNSQNTKTGAYVASVSGSKYHLPDCPGAQAIKEENKVYFATASEAKKAGYTPAANCKGL